MLSTSREMRLPLRWIAILYGRVPVDLAITSGVHTAEDVLKGVMAGAKVAMMASELLKNGVGRIGQIVGELSRWMEEHEYESRQADAGQHEPAQRGRAGGVRARQLHEGSAILATGFQRHHGVTPRLARTACRGLPRSARLRESSLLAQGVGRGLVQRGCRISQPGSL